MAKDRKPPAFLLDPKDFLADTALLSDAAGWSYFRLLCYAWIGIPGCEVGYLPADDAALARLVRKTPAQWGRIRDQVRALFVEKRGRLFHKRLLVERTRWRSRHEKAVESGRKGGKIAARKRKPDKAVGRVPQAVLVEVELKDPKIKIKDKIKIEPDAAEKERRQRAQKLFDVWIAQYPNGSRPPKALVTKNAKVFGRIAAAFDTMPAIQALIAGIPRTYPLSDGVWDAMSLERHSAKALGEGLVAIDEGKRSEEEQAGRAALAQVSAEERKRQAAEHQRRVDEQAASWPEWECVDCGRPYRAPAMPNGRPMIGRCHDAECKPKGEAA